MAGVILARLSEPAKNVARWRSPDVRVRELKRDAPRRSQEC